MMDCGLIEREQMQVEDRTISVMAICIQQPWAWLMTRPDLHGEHRAQAIREGVIRDLENRFRESTRRGEIFIRTPAKLSAYEYSRAARLVQSLNRAGVPVGDLPPVAQLQQSAVIARSVLTECVSFENRRSRWHFGRYALVFADTTPIEPVPFTARRPQFAHIELAAEVVLKARREIA